MHRSRVVTPFEIPDLRRLVASGRYRATHVDDQIDLVPTGEGRRYVPTAIDDGGLAEFRSPVRTLGEADPEPRFVGDNASPLNPIAKFGNRHVGGRVWSPLRTARCRPLAPVCCPTEWHPFPAKHLVDLRAVDSEVTFLLSRREPDAIGAFGRWP